LQFSTKSDVAAPADSNQERLLELAGSVVDALEQSRDLFSELNREEIQHWIIPWVARYQELANEDGHTLRILNSVDLNKELDRGNIPSSDVTESQTDAESNATTDREPETRSEWEQGSAWSGSDEQLLQLVERILPLEIDPGQATSMPASFANYRLIHVVKIKSGETAPQLAMTYIADRALQSLLTNTISLLTLASTLLLLWPLRHRLSHLLQKPAFWLLGLALALFSVFPSGLIVCFALLVIGLWYHQYRLARQNS
ncbi:MAG: hypothetical protein AAFV88_26195, partial [Planctomycetota bacterium]